MIKIIFTTLLLLNTIGIYCQNNLNGKLTPLHKGIRGTKIHIIPPENFLESKEFNGFVKEEFGASISVSTIPGPISIVVNTLSKENLKSQGVIVSSSEDYILNGQKIKFLIASQINENIKFSKYLLLIGTEKESYVMNGSCPEEFPDLSKAIKESMLSIVYGAETSINPFDALNIKINLEQTKLKVAKYFDNTILLTEDGEIQNESQNTINLIISKSNVGPIINDKQDFSINRLKKTPYEIETILSQEEVMLDDYKGYEIISLGKFKGKTEQQKIYQLIVFTNTHYFIIFGTTKNLNDNTIDLIQKDSKTFRIK